MATDRHAMHERLLPRQALPSGQRDGAAERIAQCDQELTDYFDPLVEQGLVQWHTLDEMTQ